LDYNVRGLQYLGYISQGEIKESDNHAFIKHIVEYIIAERKMNKYLVLSFCVVGILLGGCATSKKMKSVEIGDSKMSCGEMRSELKRIDDAEASVEDKKGVTGTNVAAFLFWLPGLAYTYYDAGQAENAINERRSHINKLYNDHGCADK